MKSARVLGLCLVVLTVALYRLLPSPVNFSPIGALALFGGFSFRNRLAAVLFPLTALFLSDLVLGFHYTMWAVYGAFAITSVIGLVLRDQKGFAVKGGAVLLSSLLFFVITNFAVWYQSGMYPMNFEGLVSCFIAGIPFLSNTISGTLVFSVVLFGGWALAENRWPVLQSVLSPRTKV